MRKISIAMAAVFAIALTSSTVQAQCHSGGYSVGGYGLGGFGYQTGICHTQNIHTGFHCYPRTHNVWSSYCYFAKYNCHGYYCPTRQSWYYWYAPMNRYLPIQYINSHRPNTNININNNTNINTNTNINGVPPLPTGAVPVPAGTVPTMPLAVK